MERVETKSCPTKQNQKIKSKKGKKKRIARKILDVVTAAGHTDSLVRFGGRI